ncbi:hypothetical protein PR202_ga27520 [Eleusine coracana subsp. coracana]|uniref:F-box domain-containing protein n=1 Tax=Eleusine coracana subsp. coracana TaxID=191504 RepID=A0AAV5DHD3_ELECO|nr:hypothetical protein PR202_ga27520 [Eleusine coracana subsp. coracana]
MESSKCFDEERTRVSLLAISLFAPVSRSRLVISCWSGEMLQVKMDHELLPDDVVTDILERVPDSISLFRCSVVCKHWRRLVADPVFLRRRRWSESFSQSSLLGFFVQRHRTNFSAQRNISSSPNLSPAFVPASPGGDSVLGPGRRLLSSFVRDDARILDKAKPLAARGGLVLVRVAPRSSEKNNILRLSVCNLLTGRLERLPTLDASLLDEIGVRGYGLIAASDYNDDDDAARHHERLAHGYSTLFQVCQDGALAWHLTRFIQLNPGKWLSPVCVAENSGTVLALCRLNPEYAYVVDLQSGSATKMQGWTSSFNYRTAVPFEINWPMFFMSRLGVHI